MCEKKRVSTAKCLKNLITIPLFLFLNMIRLKEGNWIYADNEGYIYNDRVKWIEKLPKIAKGIARGNTIVFEGK